MVAIATWRASRVILAAFGWIVLVPLATIAWFIASSAMSRLSDTGSAGIGAVSIGVSVPFVMAVWFGPVLLLVGLWLAAKLIH